jgi:outer membrane protein assembly factor BamB
MRPALNKLVIYCNRCYKSAFLPPHGINDMMLPRTTMKLNRKILIILVLLIALSITSGCYRQKYGPSFQEDLKASQGKQWYFGFNAPLTKAIISSPLLLDGKIYIGSVGGTLHCIDKEKGQIVETFQFNGGRPLKAGFRSNPVSDGKLLYISCYDHNMYAVDPNTGMSLWVFTTTQKLEAAPVIMGGKIYLANWAGRIYCIDKESGQENWFYDVKSSVRCTPAAFDGKLYFGDEEGNFYCLKVGPQAEPQWEFKAEAEIYGAPVTDGEMVWFTSLDKNIYCLNANNGELVWKYATDAEIWAGPHIDKFAIDMKETVIESSEVSISDGSIVIDPETTVDETIIAVDGVVTDTAMIDELSFPPPEIVTRLYVGSMDAKLYILDALTGELASYIDTESGEEVDVIPYICGQGRAFDEGIRGTATTDEKYVYFGAGDFAFRALDKITGKPVWAFAVRGDIRGKPLVYDGTVVFGCDDTYFYGLNSETGLPIRGAL